MAYIWAGCSGDLFEAAASQVIARPDLESSYQGFDSAALGVQLSVIAFVVVPSSRIQARCSMKTEAAQQAIARPLPLLDSLT